MYSYASTILTVSDDDDGLLAVLRNIVFATF
jgi:hypothetical protein